MDNTVCFAFVRERCWPHRVRCPSSGGKAVIRDGCDDTQHCRQRHSSKGCGSRSNKLTGTVLAGHHQPLREWLLCPFLMGLSLCDVQVMMEQQCRGLVARTPAVELRGEVEIHEVYVMALHNGRSAAVTK